MNMAFIIQVQIRNSHVIGGRRRWANFPTRYPTRKEALAAKPKNTVDRSINGEGETGMVIERRYRVREEK